MNAMFYETMKDFARSAFFGVASTVVTTALTIGSGIAGVAVANAIGFEDGAKNALSLGFAAAGLVAGVGYYTNRSYNDPFMDFTTIWAARLLTIGAGAGALMHYMP